MHQIDVDLQQFNFPIAIAYQLRPKLLVESGLNIAYINKFNWNTSISQEESSAASRAFNLDPNNAGFNNLQSDFTLEDALQRRWLFQPQFAMHYQMKPRLLLGLQYNMKTPAVLKGDTYEWNNQLMQLSLRYKILQN